MLVTLSLQCGESCFQIFAQQFKNGFLSKKTENSNKIRRIKLYENDVFEISIILYILFAAQIGRQAAAKPLQVVVRLRAKITSMGLFPVLIPANISQNLQ